MPQEAPVFYPTIAEFKRGPIDYITKIRSQAEQYGICKIVPPKSFKPPFAVDTNYFKFTPRVQRLNELEASTRTKLNFIDQLFKFWELQGSTIKVPYIERQLLDLHKLFECVKAEGGFEVCVRERKWAKVTNRMGYQINNNNRGTVASLLRHHYEKILYPHDIFQSGATIGAQDETKTKRHEDCVQCNQIKPSHLLVTCDNCHLKFHITCLIPPLKDMPKTGPWHCHSCLALLVSARPKHYADFGFTQSKNHYTLSEFGDMANQFKSEYFNMPSDQVPLNLVEQEYWRLVSCLEENVCVEYGADLHCNEFGSGFPTRTSKDLHPSDNEYIDHPWNLNNMPIAEGSVFRYINANISGMIIPWMYVGMCFSTFCWHNEDHWTYSINYLHHGDPKTWYGVPGSEAEKFERSMKRVAPDLFQSQPDLLHQLVTICNPNTLMGDQVPIYRVDQFSGEFVVTFPRAYHTGFNQGLNFAEAVNFAPADWLSMGRNCIDHYSMLRRYPVFSHDELICKMANEPSKLDAASTLATYRDIVKMNEIEQVHRAKTLDWGVTNSIRHKFELYPDDERQCDYCKTTCFLSALSCECTKYKLVCLQHKDKLCSKCTPKQHTMKFRYTLDEIPIMIRRLRKHIMFLQNQPNSPSGVSLKSLKVSQADVKYNGNINNCLT